MAVADSAGAKISSSAQTGNTVLSSSDPNAKDDLEKSKPSNDASENNSKDQFSGQMGNGFDSDGTKNQQVVEKPVGLKGVGNGSGDFKNDMRELVDMLSKLNPMAQEFVPPSLAISHGYMSNLYGYANNFVLPSPTANGHTGRRVCMIMLYVYCIL